MADTTAMLSINFEVTFWTQPDLRYLEGRIEQFIRAHLPLENADDVKWISNNVTYLEEAGCNAGRCTKCGCWVTDVAKPGRIPALEEGAIDGGNLYCEDDLPSNAL